MTSPRTFSSRPLLSRLLPLALVALVAVGSACDDSEQAPPLSTQGQWFNLQPGEPPSLERLRGQVVLLEFFASWCPHCQRAAPDVVALQRKYADQGLTVIGIHTPNGYDEQELRGFMERYGVTYPVLVDLEHQTFEAYGVRAVPHGVVIDSEGRVHWSGGLGAGTTEAEAAIEQALADRG